MKKKTAFSVLSPSILEELGRGRVARQVLAVLKQHLRGKDLKKLAVLDVGCSSGIITAELAKSFGRVVGVDVDSYALRRARRDYTRKNLTFELMDGTKLSFGRGTFDVVVCNQVYYYVENQEALASEIYSVLKKGGVSYFAGGSLIARGRNLLMEIGQKKEKIYQDYKSVRNLERILGRFKIYHYTPEIMANPRKYKFLQLMKYEVILRMVPLWLWRRLELLSVELVWVLEKP